MIKFLKDFIEVCKGSIYVISWFVIIFSILYYILKLKIIFIDQNKDYINFIFLFSLTFVVIVTVQSIINFLISKYQIRKVLGYLYDEEIMIIIDMFLNSNGRLFSYDNSNASRLRGLKIISFSSTLSTFGTNAFMHHLNPWVYEWCKKKIINNDEILPGKCRINRKNNGMIKGIEINFEDWRRNK